MLERLRPAPEAADRLRQLGQKSVWQFLNEVTLGSTRNLVEFFPVVHGFRPQSEAGIKQQLVALAKRLTTKATIADRDFLALYVMWRAWAWERLGDPDTIDRLLDDLESALTPAKSVESAEELHAITLTFLNALKQLSLENRCSREQIRRLIEYSPLVLDDAGQQIVNACKSEIDIERDKTITALPDRLRADEIEIQGVKDRLASLSDEIKVVASKADLIEQKSDGHSQALRLLSEGLDKLDQARTAVEDPAKGQKEAIGGLEKRLDDLAGQFRSTSGRQDDFQEQLKSTADALGEAITQIRAIVEPLQYKFAGVLPVSAETVESVIKEVQVLGARLATLSPGPSSEELDEIRRQLDAVSVARPVEAPAERSEARSDVSLSQVDGASSAVQTLSDASAIVASLATGLQSIGLKKSAAAELAEEISSAVLTGQVATFKGAFANLVAHTCAGSLSSGNAWNLSVPIGLNDGRSLGSALRSITTRSSATVPSVVIEGFNRSPLDCTKDTLLAYASGDVRNEKSPVFCFISLVSGIAALAAEPEYVELGPIFDLNYLDWRLFPDASAEKKGGSVSPTVAEQVRKGQPRVNADELEEVLRVLRKFMPKRNPRIERTLTASYAFLRSIRKAQSETTPTQSLAYGWLIPLCVALGLSKDEVDSELDGGKCDVSKADPRLAAMLHLEPFARTLREGDS